MPQDYEAAADKWLNGLDEDRLRDVLGKFGKMKADARRAAMADPAEAFEQAGLARPPEGTSFSLVLPGRRFFDDRPRLPELDRLFELPRIFWICFELCTWVPWKKKNGVAIGLRRFCRLVCIKI